MGHHNHNTKLTEKFVFTGREKTVLGVLIGLGVLCLALTFFEEGASEEHHLRFWTNILHNAVFFTGISFIAMFVLSAKVLAYSGWHTVWKRLLEAKAQFMIFGLIMMVIIWAGSKFGWHHLYHWDFPNITDEASECYDRIIGVKSGFLNSTFYLIATLLFGGIWYACVRWFRKLSLEEDRVGDESYSQHRKMKYISAFYMPFGGFTSAALIWLWVMSIDSHWYSTMFAWYATASWMVSAVAIVLLLIIYLQYRGYFSYITKEHIHDLGKYLFGFSIFWTYLWFSQFMLIWYANVGEETIYFNTRMESYPTLFWANLVMNFVLPLFILLRNDAKRKYGIIIFVCVVTLFGHWWDFFMMIKPGAQHTEHEWHEYKCAGEHHDTKELGAIPETNNYAKLASYTEDKDGHDHTTDDGHDHGAAHAGHGHDTHDGGHDAHAHHGPEFRMGFTIPGLLEIGTFIGFLALFLFVVFTSLTRASLVPPNDPYLEESLQHHVGYGGGDMEEHHERFHH